eukprot:m.11319 g.11319  ORF g.11319 m.11319 type:complete len:647 (-) comp3972_c0_seq1:78-2018(-)
MRLVGLLAVVVLGWLHGSVSAAVDYDVVVYGSTPAGVAAATAAGQLGMSVALYEPLRMIGGMGAAGNLALNDGGLGAERTGLAKVFTLLNGKHYNLTTEVPHPESFVAAASFVTMLQDAGVKTVKLDCRVTSASVAAEAGVSKIKDATFFCEKAPVTATVFIDASYDGDLMVAAGDIDYTWGRESNTTYNESLAGARVPGFVGVHGPQHVNALYPNGSIVKYVANISELGAPGSADDALMAFQHRMCVSGEADRVPWPKPAGYNRDDFALVQHALDASGGDYSVFSRMPPSRLPGLPEHIKKYCLCCGITVAASDQPMLNKGWANASWERRKQIVADHTYFELGTFYYLANDEAVPAHVRAVFNDYGLCADEFQDFGFVPEQLYVRISNRLVGDFVLTQNNIAEPRAKPDSIAVGDWSFDEHMTGKYAVPVGNGKYEVMLEGNFWPAIANNSNWYDVPYKAMVPKRGTGANLLVPVCLSASAVAYSSTRIENMFMNVGSAAGVAAKQLVDGSVATVQDVNVSKVQAILASTFQQRIHGPPFAPPSPSSLPKYFDVHNAGSPAWNGRYMLAKKTYSGNYMYEFHSAGCPEGLCSLYAENGTWRLAQLGKELFYLASHATGSLPPPTGWTAANGTKPAPSLAAGPVVG